MRGGSRFDADALREANRKQAMVPRGAATIDPAGTAPGLVVPTDGPTVIVLPGPPRELQAMWPAALESEPVRAVLSRATPFQGYTLRLIGIPESEIAKTLREVERRTDLAALEITTCLRGGELEIEVRHREGADAAADAVRAAVRQRHARYLFSEDGTTIDEQVAGLLRGRRVGLAESCSGGLLAARLTRLPGASEYVAGSVVAYSNQAKSDLLGVDPELIERHGAVSPEVAEAMADGALERFDADTAVSITGIAGPEGGTKEKPVGYVCFCAKLAGGASLARDPVIPGSRQDIRERSALVGTPHAADPARRRGGAALVNAGARAVRGPRRRGGPRRPPRAPRPGPVGRRSPRRRAGSWASTSPTCVSSASTGPGATTGGHSSRG